MNYQFSINRCICCGSPDLVYNDVLWKSLINEWRLSNYEVDYVNRQQGLSCKQCGCNLRTMALAMSIMRCFEYQDLFASFVKTDKVKNFKILEINEAGRLTSFISQIAGHTLKVYPEIDMMCLEFADFSFDLVVHSDVLEHVKYPVRGLSECYRILKPGGYCAFTVPMVVDRTTISRAGLTPSYHGSPQNSSDFLVYTEYGCDAWKHVFQAGFKECKIFSIEYPTAQAFVAVK